MEYIDLDTEVEIRFESERLDMLQVGYLNLNMHRIINKIAAAMLIERGWLTPDSLPTDVSEELILVRGITFSFENGSFVEKVRLKVAAVFSPRNLKNFGRDLAVNVAASLVIFGGTVALQSEPPKLPPHMPPPVIQPVTPSGPVAPDIDRLLENFASNGGGKMTYRSYKNGQVESEVILEIPNQEDQTKPEK